MTGWLRQPGNRWLLLAALGVLVLIGFGLSRSFARDDGRYAASPLKPWFDSLRSGFGPCCSDADGTALADVDWESKDGHYRVRLGGRWIEVQDHAVIAGPNRAGRTMVWPMTGTIEPNGTLRSLDGITIRCFMPGPMG